MAIFNIYLHYLVVLTGFREQFLQSYALPDTNQKAYSALNGNKCLIYSISALSHINQKNLNHDKQLKQKHFYCYTNYTAIIHNCLSALWHNTDKTTASNT